MLKHVVRAGVETVPLLLAGILASAGALPTNASQKVALPNGEVLHFGAQSGHTSKLKYSTSIMKDERGPNSVVWRILMKVPFIWDPGDKETVVRWIDSRDGQAQIKSWMTRGDTHGTVFHNADAVLRSYFRNNTK
jgi:hypothetical protein